MEPDFDQSSSSLHYNVRWLQVDNNPRIMLGSARPMFSEVHLMKSSRKGPASTDWTFMSSSQRLGGTPGDALAAYTSPHGYDVSYRTQESIAIRLPFSLLSGIMRRQDAAVHRP
jgi:hypothetical protein